MGFCKLLAGCARTAKFTPHLYAAPNARLFGAWRHQKSPYGPELRWRDHQKSKSHKYQKSFYQNRHQKSHQKSTRTVRPPEVRSSPNQNQKFGDQNTQVRTPETRSSGNQNSKVRPPENQKFGHPKPRVSLAPYRTPYRTLRLVSNPLT